MLPEMPSRILLSFVGILFSRIAQFRPRPKRSFSVLLQHCLISGWLCSPMFALSPNQPLAQLYHTSWSAKQGVTGLVTALAQTTDGYLWVGTTDGLLRFDGISFERYQPAEGSLIATSISALMAVPDGGLWVGFNRGGASFVRNGRVTNYSDSDGFPVSTVRCFARDQTGTIWAAVVGGFVHLEGRRWHENSSDWHYPGETAWALLVDRDGILWVATGSQIVYLRPGEKRFQSTGIRAAKVFALLQAPDGSIWFNDDLRKHFVVFRHVKGEAIQVVQDLDLPAGSAIFDHNGALWTGEDGLTRFAAPTRQRGTKLLQTAERFSEAEGLSNARVQTMLEDREGNVWVGTDGGLDRFRYRNVTWFPLRGGPFSLVVGPDDKVWAGSRGSSSPLTRIEDRKVIAGGPVDVFTSYRDPDGSAWLSANHVLLHWQDRRFETIAVPDEVEKLNHQATPPNPIIASAITKDRSGNLWVAFGGSGEFRLKNNLWTFVPVLPDHPDWSAGFAFTDSADRVWLFWGDRTAELDHGKVNIFSAREGLTIGPPDVIAGRDRVIWIGGESGLAFLQGDRFHTVQDAEGTGFISVTGIVATKSDGLWLSTGSGVVHIPENEIENLTEHPERRVTSQLFDLVSDLPDPVQRGEVYSSGAIQAADGKIWIATRSGAARIDPTHIYRNPVPPPVSIQSVIADEKSYSASSNSMLPALTQNLRIAYTALSLSIPERVRFRYKLEGWDKDWHEAGGRREATFTHLAPGPYTFHVIACNNDGVWNDEGAVLTFNVAPAWFQTVWFEVVCACFALLILWMLYLLRLKQLERQFHVAIDARVDERTRIARELHDTLLQSFNGLLLRFQTVSNLLPARPDEAKSRIDDVIEQASNAITEGRDAVHELRSAGLGAIELAQSIGNLAKEILGNPSAGVLPEFQIQVEGTPRNLNPMVRDEAYRIAAEALRNAIRHSEARRIEVEIRYDAERLRLRVRDNGKGIDLGVLDKEHLPGHWGLRGMRERANLIGGTFEVWSQVDSGTEVELSIPAANAYAKSATGRRFDLRNTKRS